VLRIEDLDPPRTVPGAAAANLSELRYLGIDWDEGPDVGGPYGPYQQSERSERYLAALHTLAVRGFLAEDWLSRRDLDEAASAPHGAQPIYGASERRASERVAAARRAAGRRPALRARFTPEAVAFHDRFAGIVRADVDRDVGDVVVRRSDGLFAYALAVVVDDAAMEIDSVVRGDDLLAATAAQVALQRSLALPTPSYAHVPLLHDAQGMRLAKRRGGATLAAYQAAGVDAARIRGALAVTLGWLREPRPLSPRDWCSFDGRAIAPGRWSEALEGFLRNP
jgi:glutamyl-tRNA synthetase